MTREEIIRMALEAGARAQQNKNCDVEYLFSVEQIERLLAAEQKKWQDQTMVDIHEAVLEEREACAKVAEEPSATIYECTVACGGPEQTFTQRLPKDAYEIATAIRARGQS